MWEVRTIHPFNKVDFTLATRKVPIIQEACQNCISDEVPKFGKDHKRLFFSCVSFLFIKRTKRWSDKNSIWILKEHFCQYMNEINHHR